MDQIEFIGASIHQEQMRKEREKYQLLITAKAAAFDQLLADIKAGVVRIVPVEATEEMAVASDSLGNWSDGTGTQDKQDSIKLSQLSL